MPTTYKAYGNRLIVQVAPPPEKSAGGIIIPEIAANGPNFLEGTVIDGINDWYHEETFKIGTKILFTLHGNHKKGNIHFVPKENVLCVVEETV